jgi:hypothetical protein
MTDKEARDSAEYCPICGGHGWVCERHPDRPYESGSARDCDCGAPGMPCECNGLK